MDSESKDSAQPNKEPESIAVYYQNARHHRSINADGVWVGVAPTGKVQFAVYNELRPMPEIVLHAVSKDGRLGEKVEEVTKTGVIREAQVSVLMDPALVVKFIELLQQMLSQIEALKVAPDKEPKEAANGN